MRDDLSAAFGQQARACDGLGSPFTARLMRALPDALHHAPALLARMEGFQGDVGPGGASLPLRLAGGLHYLHLAGLDVDLAPGWPPADGVPGPLLPGVLARQDGWLAGWIGNAPQTNEVGRSAVLIAAAGEVQALTGLPLYLSELGASAGLNLNFARYGLEAAGVRAGAEAAALVLAPDWHGVAPRAGAVEVVGARGADLNPLSPQEDALRLLAYVWPDQEMRLARLRAALAVAADHPPLVDRADAADWLESRLDEGWQGCCHLVYHTIAFQYFPPEVQARIGRRMAAAGAAATDAAPLAWLAMEADEVKGSAAVTLRLWPGDRRFALGRAGFHGQAVDWAGA
jgi:hypothetical protein